MGFWWKDFMKDTDAFGTDPNIMNKNIEDPYKTKVSGPLGDFIAGQIGKGIGEYPIDPNFQNRYDEFLSMNPEEYYKDKISDPAMEQYTKYGAPVVKEGFAGGLRGSGRLGAEQAGYTELGEGLARVGAEFVPKFAQAQLAAGENMFKLKYQNWYNSLAVNNPILKTAVDFLNADSGFNILAGLDPGKKGWFFDLLNAAASGAAKGATSGCWVAAEIFGGWNEPKTEAARFYVNTLAPKWFKDFYIKHGEHIAQFIHKHTFFKLLLKPLFEYFALRGALQWHKSLI